MEKIEFIQDDSPIFQIPWGHHKLIMDKVKGNLDKAFFFVSQTIKNGWSRSVLQNGIESELYERSGKSINNFSLSLPDISSELAQELTKDPYNFAFAGITKHHNETELKSALLQNITDFLVELGTGFAYVGKEYRLQIGDAENFISEYELEKFYPEKIEGTIPTIEEIEQNLNGKE